MGLPETEPWVVDAPAAAAAIAARAHTGLALRARACDPGPRPPTWCAASSRARPAAEQAGRTGADTVPAPAVIDATALNALASIEEWWSVGSGCAC